MLFKVQVCKKLKNKRSDSVMSKICSHRNFNRLQFLRTFIENNDTVCNFSTSNENSSTEYNNEESMNTSARMTDSNVEVSNTPNDIRPKVKKMNLNHVDERCVGILKKSLYCISYYIWISYYVYLYKNTLKRHQNQNV